MSLKSLRSARLNPLLHNGEGLRVRFSMRLPGKSGKHHLKMPGKSGGFLHKTLRNESSYFIANICASGNKFAGMWFGDTRECYLEK